MKRIHAKQHIKALKKIKNKKTTTTIKEENVGHGKDPHLLFIALIVM